MEVLNSCEPKLNNLGILRKLALIQLSIKEAGKDGSNNFQGYKYPTVNGLLAMIKPLLDGQGVILNMRMVSSVISDREVTSDKGKTKRMFVSENAYECIFIDTETGETYVAEKCMKCLGVDEQEKGLGKSISYAKKYFLLNFFNIPAFEDSIDPDANNANEYSMNKPSAPAGFPKPGGFKAPVPAVKPTNAKAPFEVKGDPDAPISQGQMKFWFNMAARCGIQVGNGSIAQYLNAIRGISLSKPDDISVLKNWHMQSDIVLFGKGEKHVANLITFCNKLISLHVPRVEWNLIFGTDYIETLTPETLSSAINAFETSEANPDKVPF